MTIHRTIREGVTAGVIGATTVALWFLIVDTVERRPLHTPIALGDALTSTLRNSHWISPTGNAVIYTVVHFAAFILFGLVAAAVIRASDREPSVLTGLLFLFVCFELGFQGFILMLTHTPELGSIAWYQIGMANLLATLTMGRYFWRGHPEIAPRLNAVLSGR